VIRENSSWPVVIPGLVLVGIGAGLAMASLTSTAMSAVPWQQAGMAAGALSAFRQLGYAFGIAVLGEVFDSGLSHGLSHGAGAGLSAALSGGQAPAVLARTPALAPIVHRAFADGLDLAYVVAAGLGLIAAVAVFTLVRPRPQATEPGAADGSHAAEPAPASVEA
jgi:MFS family permease